MSAVLDARCAPGLAHVDVAIGRSRRWQRFARAGPVRDPAGQRPRGRSPHVRQLSGRQPVLRSLHRVVLHAAGRRQLRVPAEHVHRRLVAVQLRGHGPLRDHEHALLPRLLDEPGRALSRRMPLRQRQLRELQDVLRGVPLRELQHGHPGRHADPVPARHVRDPVPDRLPGLQLLGRRSTRRRARTRRGACEHGALTALVVVETIVLALLAVIVVSLLRSHAEILRRLPARTTNTSTRTPTAPPADERAPTLPSTCRRRSEGVRGARRRGHDARRGRGRRSRRPRGRDTLFAFLSTGCLTCQTFWEGLQPGAREPLPGGTRVVVVVKDPAFESPSRLAKLAPPDVPVVQSSEAWEDFGVLDVAVLLLRGRRDGRGALRGCGDDVAAGRRRCSPTRWTTRPRPGRRRCDERGRRGRGRGRASWRGSARRGRPEERRCWEASLRSGSGDAGRDGG